MERQLKEQGEPMATLREDSSELSSSSLHRANSFTCSVSSMSRENSVESTSDGIRARAAITSFRNLNKAAVEERKSEDSLNLAQLALESRSTADVTDGEPSTSQQNGVNNTNNVKTLDEHNDISVTMNNITPTNDTNEVTLNPSTLEQYHDETEARDNEPRRAMKTVTFHSDHQDKREATKANSFPGTKQRKSKFQLRFKKSTWRVAIIHVHRPGTMTRNTNDINYRCSNCLC